MPIYVYKCPKCEHIVEKLHKMSENPSISCEKCVESPQMARQIGGASVHIAAHHEAVPTRKKR